MDSGRVNAPTDSFNKVRYVVNKYFQQISEEMPITLEFCVQNIQVEILPL